MFKRATKTWVGLAGIALICAAGCDDPAALKEEISRQKIIIMEQEKENQDLVAQNQQALMQLRQIQAEVGGRDEKIAILRAGLERMKKASVLSGKVQQQLQILVERFGGELIGNRLQLPGDYLFSAGRFELTSQSRELVRQLVSILKDEDLVLLVVGHTDNDPVRRAKRFGIKDNLHLSLMRAYSVVSEMTSAGYPKNRLYPTGWGDLLPIADNSSKSGKALNRRVEILIDPAASGLFPISAIYDVKGPMEGQGGVVIEK